MKNKTEIDSAYLEIGDAIIPREDIRRIDFNDKKGCITISFQSVIALDQYFYFAITDIEATRKKVEAMGGLDKFVESGSEMVGHPTDEYFQVKHRIRQQLLGPHE